MEQKVCSVKTGKVFCVKFKTLATSHNKFEVAEDGKNKVYDCLNTYAYVVAPNKEKVVNIFGDSILKITEENIEGVAL